MFAGAPSPRSPGEDMRTSLLAVLAIASLALAAPAGAQRLPTDVVPTFQSVQLRVDADTTDYSGTVHVELDVRKSTSQVQLFALDQKLDEVRLTAGGKPVTVKTERGERGLLTLTAASPLPPGKAQLDIRFTKPLDTQAVGLYRVRKDGLGYTFTQFEAEDARKAFPCWDQPAFKFPYQITLTVPERHRAITNTPVESETTKDGWRTTVFQRTPPLPSYLLAIATGPLEFTDVPGTKMPIRIVCAKGQSRLTGVAVRETPAIVAALERYFDQPYPFAKLDLIAVPEFWAGAMENPGAITYADGVLLVDPSVANDPAQRRRLVYVTAHELAHMWFGDLVTMKWWDDLWLNESFADWMGTKITNELMPEVHEDWSALEDAQTIMRTDSRVTTDPIRLQSGGADEAMRGVGIAYNKGKAVLSMFESWIGPEVFRQGLRDYLKEHAWKNAEAGDLWAALDKASKRPVADVMRGYIEQPGHALVTVEPLPGGSLRLSQRRFLNYGAKGAALSWKIPMTLRYSDGGPPRTMSVLLDGPTKVVKLDGVSKVAWVMPNADTKGYYRWSVPSPMLLDLAQNATRSMSPAERIGFLGNLGALLSAGEVHGDTYLQVMSSMADEPEPVVGIQLLSSLRDVQSALLPDDLGEPVAAYVRRTLRPMVTRFGLEKSAGEAQAVSLLRPQLLLWMGREGRDADALRVADALAKRYQSDPGSVEPAMAGVALQLYAFRGDRARYDQYRQALESAKVPAIRTNYLNALGWFEDPALQDEALRYSLSGALRPNELGIVARSLASYTEKGRDRAFRWVQENYDAIRTHMPESSMARWPSYCGGCSAERLEAGKKFFSDPAHRVPGTDKALDRTAESVMDCVSLRTREGSAVAAYLRGSGSAEATAGHK
jgi:alanyl aminopeptidase